MYRWYVLPMLMWCIMTMSLLGQSTEHVYPWSLMAPIAARSSFRALGSVVYASHTPQTYAPVSSHVYLSNHTELG